MLTAIRGEINSTTMGDFNTPLTTMDRSSRPKKKINKETQALNDTLDKMIVIYIYGMSHLKSEYTFFSSAHGTFSKIDHAWPQ